MFIQDDLIFTYTRKQALEDGLQMKLEGEKAQMAKDVGYKYPIYLTACVIDIIDIAVNNPKHCNDWNGVLWDILWMSRNYATTIDKQTHSFQVIITGVGRKKYHKFYIQCGPTDIDDPTPALTIMTPQDM